MAIQAQHDDPFIFVVKLQHARRVIALVFAGFFLLIGAYMPLRMGVNGFSYMLRVYPFSWFLVGVLMAAVAFFLWLAFPPRAVLAKLEIRHDSVSFIPTLAARRFFAEHVVKATIASQSKEIVLCETFLGKLSNGYNVIIRTTGESDRVIKAASLTLHSAQEGQEIADAITAVTGLPVRIITRRQLADGTVQEAPWVPPALKTKFAWAGLAMGALPWVGGMIVGYIFPRPAIIVVAGLALWLCEMLAISIVAHRSRERAPNLAVHMMATLFTFTASYAVAIGLVAFVLRAP